MPRLRVPAKTRSGSDHEAMLAIQELMDGTEWSSDTLDRISVIMIEAGYRIRDLNDVDLTVES